MNAERAIPTLLNQIWEELLPHIAYASELQMTENLQRFRSQLHSLHDYCVRAQIPDTVCNRVEVLLSTSADFWRLIADLEFGRLVREALTDFEVAFEQKVSNVIIKGKFKRGWEYWFQLSQQMPALLLKLKIDFQVTAPRRYNIDLNEGVS